MTLFFLWQKYIPLLCVNWNSMGTSLKSKFQGHGLFANLSCLPHCRCLLNATSIINCTSYWTYFFSRTSGPILWKFCVFLGSDARTSPIVFLYCSDFISSHCSFFFVQTRGLKHGRAIVVSTCTSVASIVSGVVAGMIALDEHLPKAPTARFFLLLGW